MDDLISRKALLDAYDRVHIGPPGGARKLIKDAPCIDRWISVSEKLPDPYVDVDVCRRNVEYQYDSVGVEFIRITPQG